MHQHLAEEKGCSYEQSLQAHQYVVDMAVSIGLAYYFSKAKPANSLRVHLLIQLAKSKDLGGEMKEALFKAYFIEGIDFRDVKELKGLIDQIIITIHSTNIKIESASIIAFH